VTNKCCKEGNKKQRGKKGSRVCSTGQESMQDDSRSSHIPSIHNVHFKH